MKGLPCKASYLGKRSDHGRQSNLECNICDPPNEPPGYYCQENFSGIISKNMLKTNHNTTLGYLGPSMTAYFLMSLEVSTKRVHFPTILANPFLLSHRLGRLMALLSLMFQ